MSGPIHPTLTMGAAKILALALAGATLHGPVLAAQEFSAAPATTLPDAAPGTMPGGLDDLTQLLPLLLTSTERRRLAEEMEAFLRQGNPDAAASRLNGAIEMGTLAIVLVDRLREPGLLATLQALGIRGGEQHPQTADAASGIRPDPACTLAASGTVALADLQEAIEREQARGREALQELALLSERSRTREDDAASLAAQVANLQEALQQQEDRSEAAVRELAKIEEEYRALQDLHASKAGSAGSQVSELEAALQQERGRSTSATRQLASLQEEVRALQLRKDQDMALAGSTVNELKGALAREKARGDAAVRDLAKMEEEYRALRHVHASKAGSAEAQVSELEAALQQERARGTSSTRQLASLQEEVRALQLRKDQDMALAATTLNELKGALARERARGDAVTRELADTIDDLRKASHESREQGGAPRMFRLEASGLQTPLPTFAEDRLPAQAPQLLLVTGTIAPAASQPAPVVVVSALPDAPAVLEAPPPRDVAARAPAEQKDAIAAATPPANRAGRMEPPKADDRLIARADALLHDGDVSGARLLLERPMEAGDGRAAFMLAETFDPHVLARMGARGIRGDAQRARELYARAQALGVPQARERIEALK